ncbi:hypothetical protein KIW84_053037 [Lathyrus oleraceus]|uniref:Uncharacterized protein n=1 Tax=Pisum sativum TaxID=3888 RepID=A0A9D4WTV6_PEA|nr:hypothetical protein KIW84_053037 [Pisum sativum]
MPWTALWMQKDGLFSAGFGFGAELVPAECCRYQWCLAQLQTHCPLLSPAGLVELSLIAVGFLTAGCKTMMSCCRLGWNFQGPGRGSAVPQMVHQPYARCHDHAHSWLQVNFGSGKAIRLVTTRTMFSNVKLWLEMQQSPKGKVHKKFVKGIELLGNEDTKQHTPSMTFG